MIRNIFFTYAGILFGISWLSYAQAQELQNGEYIADGGWGVVTLQPNKTGMMTFSIKTVSAHAHTCTLKGIIKNEKGWVDKEGVENQCVIDFALEGDALDVNTQTVEACQNYCGARASFTDVYYKMIPECVVAARSKVRNEFKKMYDKKEYVSAQKHLETMYTRCEKFIDWREMGWVRNDLALTKYKNGDKAGCRTLLAEYAEDAALPDAEIDQLRLPSDAPDYAAIVRAARANLKLCKGSNPPRK